MSSSVLYLRDCTKTFILDNLYCIPPIQYVDYVSSSDLVKTIVAYIHIIFCNNTFNKLQEKTSKSQFVTPLATKNYAPTSVFVALVKYDTFTFCS